MALARMEARVLLNSTLRYSPHFSVEAMKLTPLFLFLLICMNATAETYQVGPNGHFTGPLDLRMSGNGRTATLLAPFGFVDQTDKTWLAPKGVTVDGASIPEILWSVVGSPWTGKYREASVIHDYYCETRTDTWQNVHRVFYDAMLVNGVSELQAKIMYAAVYRFGPRWNFKYTPACEGCMAVPYQVPFYRPEPNAAEAEQLKLKVQTGNLSLEAIEREADAGFQAEIRVLELGTPQLIR